MNSVISSTVKISYVNIHCLFPTYLLIFSPKCALSVSPPCDVRIKVLSVVHKLMIIVCLEINYYSLKPKRTSITLEPKINPISIIYILDTDKTCHMDFRTPFHSYLPFPLPPRGRQLKGRLKSVYYRNPYLTLNIISTC